MPPGKEGDYAYAYGVVCGKYSRLFDHRVMENFIEARGIPEIIASLEATEYEKDIRDDLAGKATTGPLEFALKKHFMRVYDELVAAIPEGDRGLLDAIIPEELNVRNLKIILRAIHSNMPHERLMRMVEVSRKDDAEFIRTLSECKSIEEFISGLGDTPYHDALSDRLEAYKKFRNLLPLETALDKVLIEKWRSYVAGKGEIENFVGARIDIINIKKVIKCRIYNIPHQDHVFDGGLHLSKTTLNHMASADIDQMGDVIGHTIYGKAVKESIEEYKKTGSLMHLEVGLEKIIMGIPENASRFKPLSINSIINFLNLKEKEIKNLITVIICKGYNIPPREIKELMV